MSNRYFYKNLPEFTNLNEISQKEHYKNVPDDWYIIATDIKGSTKAIEAGKYKDVNMVGALTIISILNINLTLDLPFVFGGDGAFVLIPSMVLEESKQALLAIQKIAQEAYNLHLRIAILPVKDIYRDGKIILITKYKISKDYSQAIIKGGGLEYCDVVLKKSDKYEIKDNINKNFEVNLEGLECRWQAIPSPKDETLSIIIKANDDNYYKSILENLEAILGNTYKRHPILKENLNLSYSNKDLKTETAIYKQMFISQYFLKLKLKFINFLGDILMKFKIGEWGNYKDRIVSTTDTEKFDDMLRLIVSADYKQTKKLEEYLEKEYKNNKLFYGIHKSDSSLMTCLIFERHGRHIHFVDASNGGYAMAAKMYKKQILKKVK